jgi:hypothetical protein
MTKMVKLKEYVNQNTTEVLNDYNELLKLWYTDTTYNVGSPRREWDTLEYYTMFCKNVVSEKLMKRFKMSIDWFQDVHDVIDVTVG